MDGYVQDSTCGVVHHDLHNGGSWFGQQLVILCIPPIPMVKWFLDNLKDLWCLRQSEHKKSPHWEHQAIAVIGEGSQNEQNFASDWFDVAILLI
jgi:hypothetical protein